MKQLYVPNNYIDKRLERKIWPHICYPYVRNMFIIMIIIFSICFIYNILEHNLIYSIIYLFALSILCILVVVVLKQNMKTSLNILKRALGEKSEGYNLCFTDDCVIITSIDLSRSFKIKYKYFKKIKKMKNGYLFVTKTLLFFICDISKLEIIDIKQLEFLIKKIINQ
ncbi:hypothetical protein [Thomasclavelia sp.]